MTPNGNTGEFYALTPDERRAVLTSVMAARGAGTTIVAGVGFDVRTAIADARFVRDAGADAIMIHQPVLPYLAAEGWVEYNAAIAAAVPDIGVLPYLSNPAISGVHIGALAERAPNMVGLKYSVPDPVVFATTSAQARTVYCGSPGWRSRTRRPTGGRSGTSRSCGHGTGPPTTCRW